MTKQQKELMSEIDCYIDNLLIKLAQQPFSGIEEAKSITLGKSKYILYEQIMRKKTRLTSLENYKYRGFTIISPYIADKFKRRIK